MYNTEWKYWRKVFAKSPPGSKEWILAKVMLAKIDEAIQEKRVVATL